MGYYDHRDILLDKKALKLLPIQIEMVCGLVKSSTFGSEEVSLQCPRIFHPPLKEEIKDLPQLHQSRTVP